MVLAKPSGRGANPSSPPRPAPFQETVPVRATGVELLGEIPGSGYRKPPALARRTDGQTIQLTPLLYLVLGAIDGRRSYADIADRVSTIFGRLVSADNVRSLVEAKLRPLGLVKLADGSEPVVRKANPLLALRFRFVLSNPRATRRLTAPFTPLFNPLAVTAIVFAFAAVSYWVLFEKGLASATYQAFNQPALLLAIFAITVASAGFHEFGHAAAARRGGATPGAIGAGLYLVWPAFYTDVTDSYRLGRGGRLLTDLGGLYFNAVLAVAMFGAWALTGWDALLLIIATQVLQMIRQLTPLVRFDGYHVLADLTGVPDLYHRIRPTLLGLLPHRWRHPETTALKPWARVVVTVWVLLVVPLLLLSSVLMVVALPRVLATGWASLGRQWDTLGAKTSELDLAGVLLACLAILAIALPMLGVVYLAGRLAKRVVSGGWRATRGRPVRRAAAGLALLGVLAWLIWMWWPDAGRYRPIEPGERGTIGEVVHRGAARPAPHVPQLVATGGPQRTSHVAWPASSPRPTRERPALALVLTPKSGAAQGNAQTWVFPFNPPKPPGPGDNQALAINTTDNSTVYDVAFALVWVTDGRADNRNEAYALARCQNCTTVAIGFQVVLVVGQANVVVPQNIAVAVNYACVDCLTVALAKQLVLSVPGALSDAGMARLEQVWSRLTELAGRLQTLTLQQLQAELTRVETDILAIVQQEAQPVPPSQAPPGSTTLPSAPGSSPNAPPPSPSSGSSTPEPPTSTTPPPTTTTTEPPPSTTEPPPTTTP
jgi:putative peptide zinc metalloprotease protein